MAGTKITRSCVCLVKLLVTVASILIFAMDYISMVAVIRCCIAARLTTTVALTSACRAVAVSTWVTTTSTSARASLNYPEGVARGILPPCPVGVNFIGKLNIGD